jgi:hypothetical protein
MFDGDGYRRAGRSLGSETREWGERPGQHATRVLKEMAPRDDITLSAHYAFN